MPSANLRRNLARVFGLLMLITLIVGTHAFVRESNLVIVFTLTPLFAVLALAFGLSVRRP